MKRSVECYVITARKTKPQSISQTISTENMSKGTYVPIVLEQ